METKVIRIVAAVVDTKELILYKQDGSTLSVPQGDARLRKILEEATPQLVEQGWADIIYETPIIENDFLKFEQASNGVVKLFRVAKSKLAALFALGIAEEEPVDVVEPTKVGNVATLERLGQLTKTQQVVNEIIANAVPVSSEAYNEDKVAQQSNVVEECGITPNAHPANHHEDTVIAVIDGAVIPGMELIKTQFARAAKLGSTIGVESFLKRIAKVINQRSHSVEDLLKFMERGDLPIAEDGSILIYKVLRRASGQSDRYVDCHSRKVTQWVGAYVCMDERLVDHNRNNECSNGLHVARRGYIRQFSGDVCVLAKLAPEDVIAVPTYDANKMRVCGYHIIKELTQAQYALLNQNRPLTDDPDGKTLLAEALAGAHIGRTHEVRVTQQMGGGIQVKTLETVEHKVEKAIEEAEALSNPVKPEDMPKDEAIDVLALSRQVGQMSRAQRAKQMYDAYQAGEDGALEALKAFKKASKVSWDKLGIPDPDTAPAPAVVVPTTQVKAKAVELQANTIEMSEGSARERIAKLVQLELTPAVAKSILNVKKQAKKSWTVLGVDDDQAILIVQLAS